MFIIFFTEKSLQKALAINAPWLNVFDKYNDLFMKADPKLYLLAVKAMDLFARQFQFSLHPNFNLGQTQPSFLILS